MNTDATLAGTWALAAGLMTYQSFHTANPNGVKGDTFGFPPPRKFVGVAVIWSVLGGLSLFAPRFASILSLGVVVPIAVYAFASPSDKAALAVGDSASSIVGKIAAAGTLVAGG